MIWLLKNWKLIGAGSLILAAGIWYWNNQRIIANLQKSLELEQQTSAVLRNDVSTLVNANSGLKSEVDRLNEEKKREIKIVEIAAITRTEHIETSRSITEDLPDEEPMCGPWGQYFANVVQYTGTTSADSN